MGLQRRRAGRARHRPGHASRRRSPARAPTIAWIAHVDTSPETSGKDVKPIVHRNYDGGDIVLPGDPTKVIRVADNPELAQLKGKTIITTDGTTLLGADDKAGVAVIMEAAAHLLAHPEIAARADPHLLHLRRGDRPRRRSPRPEEARAPWSATRSTAAARARSTARRSPPTWPSVTITRRQHPPGDRQGPRWSTPIRLAGLFLDRLPRLTLSPETTDDREGFLHPYRIEGGVGRGDDAHPAARLRHAEAGRAGRAAARRRRGLSRPSIPQATDRRAGARRSTATWPTGWRRSRGPWRSPRRRCGGPAWSRS